MRPSSDRARAQLPLATAATPPLLQRAAPFLLAIALGLLLLPLQRGAWEVQLLSWSLGTLVALLVTTTALARHRGSDGLPRWFEVLLPYWYMLAVVILRAATGGPASGYAALLFLAPFWVSLYGGRRQLLLVTAAMFAALAGQAVVDPDIETFGPLRGALLTTLVIGMMSLAVQQNFGALRVAKQRLRREVDARAAANEALERSNRDLEQFAYVSSHDLQEPLRMIRSFSQLLVQRYGESLDTDARELLAFVTDGAERAQQLVSDLLEYSRIGSSTRAFEQVSLDEIVDRAIELLTPSITEADARVMRVAKLPTIHGDPGQLERLFVNLIANAVRYRDPARQLEVRIASEPSGPGQVVTVSDNGIGFDDEHAERIFKMFQRLHPRDEYGGTGIGLAICERIVERHGGTIRAHGEPGVGSTFSIELEAPR